MAYQGSSIYVQVDERFGVDKSLRRFKRMCEAFGVVKEYKKRQDYRKPSVRLKEKTEAAAKRRLKARVKARRTTRV